MGATHWKELKAGARERLGKDRRTEDIDNLRAEAALRRAIVRTRVVEKAI